MASKKANRILIILFLAINGVVLYNAIFHTPTIGYDSPSHIKNIVLLSLFKLPAPSQSSLFYMPPLTYFLPAITLSLTKMSLAAALKIAQLCNVLFSVGLTFYLLKICEIIRPNNTRFKILSLLFIGMMPVYYKTFAFIRGEPLAAFLTVFVIYKVLIIFVRDDHRMRNVLALGIALGLAILSRQTGLFLFPIIAIFVAMLVLKKRQLWTFFVRTTVLVFLIAFIIGGWFYIHLYSGHGTIASYNITPMEKFSFSNQSPKFYFDLALNKVFKDPIRPAFPNRFLPTFYSEFWGDYLCYFVVYGIDTKNGDFIRGYVLEEEASVPPYPKWLRTNRDTIKGYMGRVNAASLFPSLIMLAGFMLGIVYLVKSIFKSSDPEKIYTSFSLPQLVIVVSFAAFMYFLIMYPSPIKGDNIKATYMLHVFPFIAILAGEFVYKISQKSRLWYMAILILLVLSVAHNFPVFFTRYTPWQ